MSPMTAHKRRWLLIIASVAIGALFCLSTLRLWQAVHNGSELTILRGKIAVAVSGAALATAMVAAWRIR